MARLFAMMVLLLCSAGNGMAASDPYGEEDPFDERDRIRRVRDLGWDMSQELDVEFRFEFVDHPEENRERFAQAFAARLRRLGYPAASAKPCANAEACWQVVAPKRVLIDTKKLTALSKQLDQLAADDTGHYRGWDCQLFRDSDDGFLAAIPRPPAPTLTPSTLLTAFEELSRTQCLRVSEDIDRETGRYAAEGKGYMVYSLRSSRDLICTCWPDRAQQVREALLPAERDMIVTEADFTQRYGLPRIIQPCIAEMARKMYGDNCPRLAEAWKANVASYCPCMQAAIGALSETEITQLGLESGDYVPLLARAEKEGKSPPEPPPLFKRFMEKEATCRK